MRETKRKALVQKDIQTRQLDDLKTKILAERWGTGLGNGNLVTLNPTERINEGL
jgi:hypothetical protein